MKREQSTARLRLVASAGVQPLAPLRPRDAGTDALVKHVHASQKFSFEAARAAIGAALKKAKTVR